MAISFTSLSSQLINDSVDRSSYSNSAWTPTNTSLIVLFVHSYQQTGTPATPTVSGNGQTWTQISTFQGTSTSQTQARITLFGCYVSSATNTATTIDFGGSTQRQCYASFLQVDGSDAQNGLLQTFVQTPHNESGLASSFTVTLSAASNSNNRPVASFSSSGVASNMNATASWTKYANSSGEDTGEDTFGALSEYRGDAFSTSATITMTSGSEVFQGMATEIKIFTAVGPTNLKTVNNLAKASIKTIEGLAMASVKTYNGLA